MCKLKIKVVPGASNTVISGWLGDSLKIKVSAPPEKGKANALVEAVMCKALGLPKGAVQIVSGKSSPNKVVEISGLSEVEVHSRLAQP